MQLRPITLKCLDLSAKLSGAICGVSMLSLSLASVGLFASSPFVADSTEAGFKRWIFLSGESAAFSGLVSLACFVMRSAYSDLLLDEEEEKARRERREQLDRSLEALNSQASALAEPPSCANCDRLDRELRAITAELRDLVDQEIVSSYQPEPGPEEDVLDEPSSVEIRTFGQTEPRSEFIQSLERNVFADVEEKTPQVCRSCAFLNPELSTRSFLLCAASVRPESSEFCLGYLEKEA